MGGIKYSYLHWQHWSLGLRKSIGTKFWLSVGKKCFVTGVCIHRLPYFITKKHIKRILLRRNLPNWKVNAKSKLHNMDCVMCNVIDIYIFSIKWENHITFALLWMDKIHIDVQLLSIIKFHSKTVCQHFHIMFSFIRWGLILHW